jgi:hypothetical protein
MLHQGFPSGLHNQETETMKKLLLGLIFVCTGVHAGVYETGNTLLRDMDGTEMGKMYALGYITGAADSYNESLCIPKTVTKGQLNDVVYRFLRVTPQHRDLPADVLVLLALGEHWSCPKTDNKRRKS